MSRDLPIIFTGPSPALILDDKKTMTRRVVKQQPPPDCRMLTLGDGYWGTTLAGSHSLQGTTWAPCPYGKPGDLLRVKESWRGFDVDGGTFRCGYKDGTHRNIDVDSARGWLPILIKASREHPKWQSPLYMPKECSRLWLRVTDVRVERLQEISVEDIVAEGVRVELNDGSDINNAKKPDDFDRRTEAQKESWYNHMARAVYMARCDNTDRLFAEFIRLWDSINAKRGYGWDINPWAWAITFERTEAPL